MYERAAYGGAVSCLKTCRPKDSTPDTVEPFLRRSRISLSDIGSQRKLMLEITQRTPASSRDSNPNCEHALEACCQMPTSHHPRYRTRDDLAAFADFGTQLGNSADSSGIFSLTTPLTESRGPTHVAHGVTEM